MAGIGVVHNPRSRKNQKDPKAAARLAQTLGDRGVVREATSVDELHRIAEDFLRLGIDVLAVSGGDGTNHVTITGFLAVYGRHGAPLPTFAFLRGGTMNTVAAAVGMRPGDPHELLLAIADAHGPPTAGPRVRRVERNLMRIGPAHAPERAAYGFIFGTGVVSGFLAEYYKDPGRSPLSAAKMLARGIGSAMIGGELIARIAAPFHGSVSLADGSRWSERAYLAIAAGTIDHIGLGFRPFHRHAEAASAFHILGVHAPPAAFVLDLPRVWRGQGVRPSHAYDATATGACLESATGVPIDYTIDGDLHRADGPLRVDIGPRLGILVVP